MSSVERQSRHREHVVVLHLINSMWARIRLRVIVHRFGKARTERVGEQCKGKLF